MDEFRAYYIELPDHNLAILLMDEGDRQQVYTGVPESIEAAASLLEITPVRLKGRLEADQYYEKGGVYRRWFKADDTGTYYRQVLGGGYDLFSKHTIREPIAPRASS